MLWCAMSARGKLTDMMTLMLGFPRDARGATGCYGVLWCAKRARIQWCKGRLEKI